MQHVFTHQNPYHQPDWQHHAHGPSQHHYQSQAAAAATAAAAAQQQQQQQQQAQQQQQQQQQQQHYGRMNQNGGGTNGGMGQGLGPARDLQDGSIFGAGDSISEENRRVLEWIAQVLNANTRESALLELSKKREQVPELALILWHSFGKVYSRVYGHSRQVLTSSQAS
jgi:CCR4-NOT transcription complex subunit 9